MLRISRDSDTDFALLQLSNLFRRDNRRTAHPQRPRRLWNRRLRRGDRPAITQRNTCCRYCASLHLLYGLLHRCSVVCKAIQGYIVNIYSFASCAHNCSAVASSTDISNNRYDLPTTLCDVSASKTQQLVRYEPAGLTAEGYGQNFLF